MPLLERIDVEREDVNVEVGLKLLYKFGDSLLSQPNHDIDTIGRPPKSVQGSSRRSNPSSNRRNAVSGSGIMFSGIPAVSTHHEVAP